MNKHTAPKNANPWSDKETFLLLKCAGHISKELIATILNISVDRVVNKAAAQGIPLGVKS